MKLKLSIWNAGFLMPDTSVKEKEWDITKQELIEFQKWFLILTLWENWELIKIINDENKKETLKSDAYSIFHETLKQINEKYTENEQKTFEIKRQEAEKMKNNPEYISIFIQSLCTDWENIVELRDKIIENSLNYQLLYATAEKKLREDLIAIK